MQPLDKKTIDALGWIVEIFDRLEVPYRIGGGFGAKCYGSPRPLNDLDFGIPEKYFPLILPEVSGYITWGPDRWDSDGKWDCELITLKYHGQEIDISGSDTIKISNKARTKWMPVINTLPLISMEVEGVKIKLMNPKDLVAYKKELDGDHQQVDIKAIEEYLARASA